MHDEYEYVCIDLEREREREDLSHRRELDERLSDEKDSIPPWC